MLGRRAVTILSCLALFSPGVGCAATSGRDDGDGSIDGTAEETLSKSAECQLTRDEILSSTTPARRRVIGRGFDWLDAKVPYSQSRTYDEYRTDCSGFVSMCWELGQSYTTASFRSGGGDAHPLGSYESLLPGDALVGSGHMVLFVGWADPSRSIACVLEQSSTANDMQFRARATSSFRSEGYRAIRADKLRSDADTSADPESMSR